MSQVQISRETEEFLEDLIEELAVPPGRYEQAERSYNSLGEWLLRPTSTVRPFGPKVYVQGSFRLATTIRPVNEAEEYDVDSVCEFQKLDKTQLTQFQLKTLLGTEIEAYRKSQNMSKPMREGRRCWILDYSDDAQFHMDIVPSISNGESTRILLERYNLRNPWINTAIAITDRKSANYHMITEDWPRSNPKGYGEWFKSRMAAVLASRKRVLAESTRMSVEAIPDYRVRTPLQSAIMILKRHRDYRFQGREDDKPISVIITTLAAHSYAGEETIGRALETILTNMHKYIQQVNGRYWIVNPSDPLENFADKWAEYPQRAEAFFQWLELARREFGAAARSQDKSAIEKIFEEGFGGGIVKRAAKRRQSPGRSPLLKTASVAPVAGALSFPNASRTPTKPEGFA